MADNSTPAAPAAPAAPAPGTGTNATPAAPAAAGGDPKIPTDPAEAAKYWQDRHTEATATITKVTQRESRYKDMYGELEPETPAAPPPAAGADPAFDARFEQKYAEKEMDRDISRIPTLVPHSKEIKDLVRGGLTMEEAKETVAKRRGVTLGPAVGPMDMMPTIPGGGGAQPASGFTNDQLEAMKKDGIDPEKAKKHVGTINEIARRALKR